MKTILKLQKTLLILLFFAALDSSGQITTIMTALANPCSLVPLANNNPIYKNDFTIYPNPSDGQVNVLFESNDALVNPYISIYDIKGLIVFEKQCFNQSNKFSETLQLQDLAAGLYFIIINTDKNKRTQKLIINK